MANNDNKDKDLNLMGQNYSYPNYIKNPKELGISTRGTFRQIGKNVSGLLNYTTLMVTGNSNASKNGGKPLGDKYFLRTLGTCKPVELKDGKIVKNNNEESDDEDEVSRYMYINNVPTGNIPLISSAAGNFSSMKGLVPGAVENLNALNPVALFDSFTAGPKPECIPIEMNTIDEKNNKNTEKRHVALMDIKNMDPCLFNNRKNPVTKKKCRETFSNITTCKSNNNDNEGNPFAKNLYAPYLSYEKKYDAIKKDENSNMIYLYLTSMGLLGFYLMYKIKSKS
jgi:hypothetical protein